MDIIRFILTINSLNSLVRINRLTEIVVDFT